MEANIGGIDKALRFVIGAALIAWAVMGGPLWAWLGVTPLLSALINFCPLYAVFGMNTCSSKPEHAE